MVVVESLVYETELGVVTSSCPHDGPMLDSAPPDVRNEPSETDSFFSPPLR